MERTKPTGRVIGIDIIPAQPPKGVSTIQGNFLSQGVQDEVKRFLLDPDKGRPRQEQHYFTGDDTQDEGAPTVNDEQSSLEMQPKANQKIQPKNDDSISTSATQRRKDNDVGKMVDVVLSDMSAPFDQVTGFWKRSLTSPYLRMMNTSGINFKDHAGSMVCISDQIHYEIPQIYDCSYPAGPLCSCAPVLSRYSKSWRPLCM